MKYFHKQRLLKLADFIENLPKKKFNLNVIAKGKLEEFNKAVNKKMSCGTVACAMGWMPCVFPRLCKYVEDDYSYNDITIVSKNKNYDYYAAIELFDIDWDTANYLFTPFNYPKNCRGQKSVAKRIR